MPLSMQRRQDQGSSTSKSSILNVSLTDNQQFPDMENVLSILSFCFLQRWWVGLHGHFTRLKPRNLSKCDHHHQSELKAEATAVPPAISDTVPLLLILQTLGRSTTNLSLPNNITHHMFLLFAPQRHTCIQLFQRTYSRG